MQRLFSPFAFGDIQKSAGNEIDRAVFVTDDLAARFYPDDLPVFFTDAVLSNIRFVTPEGVEKFFFDLLAVFFNNDLEPVFFP